MNIREDKNALTSFTLFSVLMVICIFAWLIQDHVTFNWDVSWLLEASRRMLAGGTYANDFFENNPPLILYLYLPPVLLTKLTHLNIMISLRIYEFSLAILSIVLTSHLFQKIFTKDDVSLVNSLLIMLTLIFLVIPAAQFGQRENLLVILSTPYLFLMVCRLEDRSVRPALTVFIGVLAALGFYLKPYFLLSLVLVECYYLLRKRQWLAWCRPEIFAMLGVLLIYLVVIAIRHTDYLLIVIPYMLRWVRVSDDMPYIFVLTHRLFIYCLLAGALSGLYLYLGIYRNLLSILLLTFTGYIGAYIIQHTSWYYHILPAVSMVLILLVIIMYVTMSQLLLTFSYRKAANAVLIGLMLCIPFNLLIQLYQFSIAEKRMLVTLSDFMDTYIHHHSLTIFTTEPQHTYPAISYAKDTHSASRFGFFIGLAGIIRTAGLPSHSSYLDQDRIFFINMITEDLKNKKPDFVMVDDGEYKRGIDTLELKGHKVIIHTLPVDYLAFFSRQPNFKREWANYRYFTTIAAGEAVTKNKSNLQLKVYRRQTNNHGLQSANMID